MAIAYMLGWWYSQGWGWVLRGLENKLQTVGENFSVSILLRTWFAPWKQIQSPKSFNTFITSTIDNFVSRFIGAIVRTGMLLAAFLLTILILAGGLIALTAWPLLPLLIILLPAVSLAG